MHSLKGEASMANSSQSEGSVSAPSASCEPGNTLDNSQSRNAEHCETSSSSNTNSDTAAGTVKYGFLAAREIFPGWEFGTVVRMLLGMLASCLGDTEFGIPALLLT